MGGERRAGWAGYGDKGGCDIGDWGREGDEHWRGMWESATVASGSNGWMGRGLGLGRMRRKDGDWRRRGIWDRVGTGHRHLKVRTADGAEWGLELGA